MAILSLEFAIVLIIFGLSFSYRLDQLLHSRKRISFVTKIAKCPQRVPGSVETVVRAFLLVENPAIQRARLQFVNSTSDIVNMCLIGVVVGLYRLDE